MLVLALFDFFHFYLRLRFLRATWFGTRSSACFDYDYFDGSTISSSCTSNRRALTSISACSGWDSSSVAHSFATLLPPLLIDFFAKFVPPRATISSRRKIPTSHSGWCRCRCRRCAKLSSRRSLGHSCRVQVLRGVSFGRLSWTGSPYEKVYTNCQASWIWLAIDDACPRRR